MRPHSFASPARTHGTKRKRRRNEADLPVTGVGQAGLTPLNLRYIYTYKTSLWLIRRLRGGGEGTHIELASDSPHGLAWTSNGLAGVFTGVFTGVLTEVLTGVLTGVFTGVFTRVLTGVFTRVLAGVLTGALTGVPAGGLTST